MSSNTERKIDAAKESKLAYKLRVLKDSSFKKLDEVITLCHQQSGKSKAAILLDMVHCLRKFGAGYYDYLIFQMWTLTEAQRDTYLTRFRSKKLIEFVNDKSYSHIFDNKDEMNTTFRDYIGREFLIVADSTRDDIKDFFNKREKIFCKMRDLGCGDGAEKLYTKDFESADAFCDYVYEKGFATLEDVIENHPVLAEIYPDAVNTMRMVTLIGDDGKPYLLYAVLKFGRDGRIVDNYGVQSPIDLETGKYVFPAHPGDSCDHRSFTHHPTTGKQLIGLQVPYFEEAKAMVLKAAMVVPQVRYVGWDVAITPTGPAIIEGNNYTAHDFVQLPFQTPDKIGTMPLIKSIVPSFNP